MPSRAIAVTAALLAVAASLWSRSPAVHAGSELPASLTFEPVADTFVRETQPATSFGDEPVLEVDGEPRQRTFLKFDLQGLGGQEVVRARLRMSATDPSPKGGTVVWVPNRSWTEAMTWNTQPAMGESLGGFEEVLAGSTYTAQIYDGPFDADGRVALALRSGRANGASWSSSEGADPPQLILDLAPRIAAAGDIACDPDRAGFNDGAGTTTTCKQRATSRLLVNGDFAAVLALGDTQYEDGVLNDYAESYDPSWGRVLSITHPVVGNHEYHTDADGYFAYFGERAGTQEAPWYSFDLGAWHLIALDSNCDEIGGCGPGSPQMTWLANDLAASDATCTLAFTHHPRFSSGLHGNEPMLRDMWATMDLAGVDVFLSGHDHGYERFARQDSTGTGDSDGIRQFVVGTGGKGLRPFEEVKANSQVRNRSTFGVLRLVLLPDEYRWRFLRAAGGDLADAGATRCR